MGLFKRQQNSAEKYAQKVEMSSQNGKGKMDVILQGQSRQTSLKRIESDEDTKK